ncbi:hypothetical protein H6504_04365 [Candidatus Woesearchaeota archaeon]|nr:hypothetical protein [Candidatus Woesearchaeota archaeon]
MEQQHQDIKMPPGIKPIYADECNVNANIKINIEKTPEGHEKIRKAGKVDMLFLDQFTRSILARVVIDPYTAKVFGKILLENADRLINEIENPHIPEEVRQQIKDREEAATRSNQPVNTYIG